MNSDPSMTVEACRQLGLMYTASNKRDEAIEAFAPPSGPATKPETGERSWDRFT